MPTHSKSTYHNALVEFLDWLTLGFFDALPTRLVRLGRRVHQVGADLVDLVRRDVAGRVLLGLVVLLMLLWALTTVVAQ